MGYIRQPSIKSQIETNTYLDIICQNAESTKLNIDAIADEIISYMDTGKLNELNVHSNLTALRNIATGICELAKKAKLEIEIHE